MTVDGTIYGKINTADAIRRNRKEYASKVLLDYSDDLTTVEILCESAKAYASLWEEAVNGLKVDVLVRASGTLHKTRRNATAQEIRCRDCSGVNSLLRLHPIK